MVQTDPSPGFKVLVQHCVLHQHWIIVELRHAKNVSKNPVAEKAIQELTGKLLHLDPLGSAVTPQANPNSHVRSRGLSSLEMWTQHYQFSNAQVPLDDSCLVVAKHQQCCAPCSVSLQ